MRGRIGLRDSGGGPRQSVQSHHALDRVSRRARRSDLSHVVWMDPRLRRIKIMKRLAVITGAAIIAAFGVAAASTTNLHIEGMTCGSCATAVRLVLKKTPGVVSST